MNEDEKRVEEVKGKEERRRSSREREGSGQWRRRAERALERETEDERWGKK